MEAGERFADDFDLGAVPASVGRGHGARSFGILVLMVDAIDGVSGAACRLPDLDVVLINRHEVPGPPPFRSGPRALPYSHLGRDAAGALGGSTET